MVTIRQVFLNADLRGSHNWLTELAKKKNINVNALQNGEMVVFVNRRKTMMKVYTAFNSVVHTKQDRIDLGAIEHLPQIFSQYGQVNYSKALAKKLQKLTEKKANGE